MKPINHALTFLVCVALTGCSWLETRELNSQIEAKKKELATVTEELTEAAGTEFAASRHLQTDLKYGAISEWARQAANPLNITAVGISGEGDLRYREGVYKVWIDRPGDSRIRVSISQLTLEGKEGELEWRARVNASAETRVRLSILTGRHVDCRGASAPVLAGGTIRMGTAAASVPYAIHLTQPSDIPVEVTCSLGAVGDLKFPFNISDLSRVLSEGKFDLGFAFKGRVSIPVRGKENVYEYTMSPRDTSFSFHDWGMKYQTNLDVAVVPTEMQ